MKIRINETLLEGAYEATRDYLASKSNKNISEDALNEAMSNKDSAWTAFIDDTWSKAQEEVDVMHTETETDNG